MSQSPEQKIMELEAKVKLLEKQKSFLERQAFVADKKSNHFDMMIDIAEEEYKIDIRKTQRTIDHFKHKEKQTIMFACNLSGVDRPVYYRRIKRKTNKEAKAIEVVSMINQVRKIMPRLLGKKSYHILMDDLNQ
jgi:hypothetical protein